MPRDYFPGMGKAVADRTINRGGEGWHDVAARVAAGSHSVRPQDGDEAALRSHLEKGTVIMSGRHLQHGDLTQNSRPLEIFSNCSTSIQRSVSFYLLLSGAGVGSSADDEICIVDFRNMPKVICVLDDEHPDANGAFPVSAKATVTFDVPDTREGWAQALEMIEVMAWDGTKRDQTLVLDFSRVRPSGSPIAGMQNRPASGPVPLMEAIMKIATIRDQADWEPWKQAMHFDHYAAECVLVGGARRAARIVVKDWRDPGIFEFIKIKQGGDLWSANNSIGADAEFWAQNCDHSRAVYKAAIEAQYHHGSGEPGFLNMDMLSVGETPATIDQVMHVSGKYKLGKAATNLRRCLARAASELRYATIINPCSEIRINVTGGYCVIGNTVPYHAESDEEAYDAFVQITRALLRANRLPALYQGEVNRTNRIGVGLTGIHEYAWSRFGLGWKDLVAEGEDVMWDANGHGLRMPSEKAMPFWEMLTWFATAVDSACLEWCAETGATFPTTRRMIAPTGTVSKLFGLSEGAHLPPMREYLRWVQFKSTDPLVQEYETKGYPVRHNLRTYKGMSIVGFPTRPVICSLGMGDALVTAPEATPDEQFRFLRLLETFWLLGEGGNQVSYTLKYDPKIVDFQAYDAAIRTHMPLVRAVSIMPTVDNSHYEYLPETEVSAAEYIAIVDRIEHKMSEEIDRAHLDCSGGACPVTFFDQKAA